MVVLLRTLCLLSILFGVVEPFFFGIPFRNPFNNDAFGVSNDYDTAYKGGWELACENSGVSAMHLILFPNNKAIMFDATVFGPSQIALPNGDCRIVPNSVIKNEKDCWAHAVEYDIYTAAIRPLKVLTDTWCSSGGLSADGTLVHTGGWNDGGRAVRYLSGCDTCDWKEYPTALSGQRWYSTQQILPDGSFIVIGGRRMFSFEFVPAPGASNLRNFKLPFLRQTTDVAENNLYPFVHLSPDGNLFILANSRSILLNPYTKSIVREFPVLEGGSRNYPASALSALLPIDLRNLNGNMITAEVLVCGGAKSEAASLAEKGNFLTALQDCGRIQITDSNPQWKIETMPTPRVMGDMLILPNGDILMLNGAKKGVSGWKFAEEPNLAPVLYNPAKPENERFVELVGSTIPRMYHSSSAVLPDGKILVAGSNTNNMYNFTGVKFPTEMRVEKFWPPYLDPLLASQRPSILTDFTGHKLSYGQNFQVQIKLMKLFAFDMSDLKVTMYAPPFTTHGFSMNQRLLVLRTNDVIQGLPFTYELEVVAPPFGAVAPPGYYLLFVVFRGVPSEAVWAQIG